MKASLGVLIVLACTPVLFFPQNRYFGYVQQFIFAYKPAGKDNTNSLPACCLTNDTGHLEGAETGLVNVEP